LPSVVAIVRDEGPYLAEWVAFHRLQGFDRFLIYDNESSDDGPELAESLGCEVLSWPGEVQQLPAYHDALNRLDDKAWAAFIDVSALAVDRLQPLLDAQLRGVPGQVCPRSR
jgi:hypothetical protein